MVSSLLILLLVIFSLAIVCLALAYLSETSRNPNKIGISDDQVKVHFLPTNFIVEERPMISLLSLWIISGLSILLFGFAIIWTVYIVHRSRYLRSLFSVDSDDDSSCTSDDVTLELTKPLGKVKATNKMSSKKKRGKKKKKYPK